MFLTLDRLCERAGQLSNHIRRYILAVQRHRERVVTRLEGTGNQGRISFGDPARDLRREMGVLVSVARDADEKIDFLGFYFALQYIIMEIHCLDLLKFHLIQGRGGQSEAYGTCVRYAHERFQELSSTYLGMLCEILIPETFRDRWVLLGVGTMGDRDDIDVAVIDDLDSDGRRELSRSLSRLAQVMQRSACVLHFHMAEEIGSPVLSESLECYQRFAGQRPYNPVVISQVLHALPLVGSADLAGRFARQVGGRFFFNPVRRNRDHEGFLRAMMGELKEMLQRSIPEHYISPKEDGLRLIKGYLALAKSIHHVPRRDWPGMLDFLRYRSSGDGGDLAAVGEALSFLEATRYLYQVLIVEEEEIATTDSERVGSLATVASRMGFQRRGGLGPELPFLMTYYDVVDQVRGGVNELMGPLVDHLRKLSSLSFVVDLAQPDDPQRRRNIAISHVKEARRFFGTRFWEDLIEPFSHQGSRVGLRWVTDLARLTPRRREVVIRGLVEWGVHDVASFIRFLTPIHHNAEALGERVLFSQMLDIFFSRCREEELMGERLASLFKLWPAEVHRFLGVLDEPSLLCFSELAAGRVEHRELAEASRNLAVLLKVHRVAGGQFLRSFRMAMDHHAQALPELANPTELRQIANMLYGQAERFSDLFSRREWLESYFNLETARLGLELLAGRPYPELLREYRTNMHVLLRSLYFLCRKELYELYGMEWSKRHAIGVFLDAGCTGFQPFASDLGMLALVFQEDAEMERFFAEVVSSFQLELERLGFCLRTWPPSSGCELAPRRLEEQRDLVESSAEVIEDPTTRLGLLKFSRVVGTRGHLSRFFDELVTPLIEPVDGRLEDLVRHRVNNPITDQPSWQATDPELMAGGLHDLELFYLHRCRRVGAQSLSGGQMAYGVFDPDCSAELEELHANTIILQGLTTARRLLRSTVPSERTSLGFLHEHGAVLRARPEIPDAVADDPEGELYTVGQRNLSLMCRELEIDLPTQ